MTGDGPRGASLGAVGALAATLLALAAAPASGFELVGDPTAVSPPPTTGAAERAATLAGAGAPRAASLAASTRSDDTLIVWEAGSPDGGREIMGRLLDGSGQARTDIVALTTTGAGGDAAADAAEPDVVYNAVADEYLVVWRADPGIAPMTDNEYEIWARRVSATGAPVGTAVRVSEMGPDGDAGYGALTPAVAWSQTAGRYLVTWWGDDDSAGLANGEFEIYGQLLAEDLTPVGDDIRLSDMGADGDADYDATTPDAAWDPVRDQFLVVWSGDDDSPGLINNGNEIFGQRLSSAGVELGADIRISHMGPDSSAAFDATDPAVAPNPGAGEFLVVWSGDDDGPGLGDDHLEIFGQRIGPGGGEIGPDVRLTRAGPDGDASFAARTPALDWQSAVGGYLLSWAANDDAPALQPGEIEILGRSVAPDLSGGTDQEVRISRHSAPDGSEFPAQSPSTVAVRADGRFVVAWHGAVGPDEGQTGVFSQMVEVAVPTAGRPREPLPPACGPALEIATGPGDGTVRLSAAQLAINQRIGQAAVRRANAIQAWLDAGIVSGDICAGSIGAADLDAGIAVGPADRPIGPRPTPRALEIAPASAARPGAVRLSERQLLINQRIYQAAVRRANALSVRLAGLTGGDVRDGTLAADRLATNIVVTARVPAAEPPAPSRTRIEKREPRTAKVRLDAAQLAINQKIAQAAVRRTNDLRVAISSGLTGANFRDGSITAVDLGPGG